MKPIIFTVPSSVKQLVNMLGGISQTSLFKMEPDPIKRSSAQKENYRIMLYHEEADNAEVVGLLEVARKKEDVSTVTISESNPTQHDALPDTGSPLTRFVSMIAQKIMTKKA